MKEMLVALRRRAGSLPWRDALVMAARTLVVASLILVLTGLMFAGVMYVLTVYTFNR
jgi:hypothetical protein